MDRRAFVKLTGGATLATSALARGPVAAAPVPTRKIFVYGGDFDARFTRYVALLTGKPNPRVCFLPTATGDAPGYVMRWFETCANLPLRPLVQRAFISSSEQQDSFDTILTGMDAIIVGGGNTLNMLAIWQAQGIDKALRRAWEQGVVLAGGSAGSLCWFEQGTTDSRPGGLTTVQGLGLLVGSHCPHYHAEAQRKPLYWAKIKSQEYKAGYACDDRAGLYFEDQQVKRVVALDEQSNAYYVSLTAGEVREKQLPKELLP